MEPRRDEIQLIDALRSLRPTPRPEFTAELDERAAAGFPRRRGGSAPLAARRLLERLRATPPRRLLAPAGAFAVLAIGAATAVIALSEVETANRSQLSADVPAQPSRGALKPPAANDATAATEGSSGVQYSAPVQSAEARQVAPLDRRLSPERLQRDIERSAQIVLGSDPAEVRRDSAKVLDAVHAFDGIVMRSAIRDGAEGEAGAVFDLLIPSRKLGDALAAFSAIAEVRSRREATRDITAPTVNTGERLRDTRAKIESLLVELAGADTSAERSAIETRLRAERRFAAWLRSRLDSLQRRAAFSRVSLRIETGAASAADDGGAWGVSDGLDDAGRVLTIAAGVTVIALAILAPLAAICLLAWLVHRLWTRRRREQALS
jgi:hypothetical protein